MTDLSVKSALGSEGWHLSDDGFGNCSSACADNRATVASLHGIALNHDLREIGAKSLSESIPRGVAQEVKAPLILQIQKVVNIAVPSYHQRDGGGGGGSVRLLKLQLTDGHSYCNALEIKHTPQLSLSLPPGTKLKIISDVLARNGFLLLTPSSVKVLGGHVDHMVEKWKSSKVVVERGKLSSDTGGGPPAFTPFSEATSKRQHSAKPVEQGPHVTKTPTYTSTRQRGEKNPSKMSKPRQHQAKAADGEVKQTGDKLRQHHQGQPPQQAERFQDRPRLQHDHPQGRSSKDRTHSAYSQKRYTKTPANDRQHGQFLSDFSPVTFRSKDDDFPALSLPTNRSYPSSAKTDNKKDLPPQQPMLAWGSQGPFPSTTGGSVPFSAKQDK